MSNWFKVNTGTTMGCPGLVSCAGKFSIF